MTQPVLPEGDDLPVTVDDAVATLWLHRPAKRNAITRSMWARLPSVLDPLAKDRSVRVVVVRGSAATFSAGADISEIGDQLKVGPDGHSYAELNEAAEQALATFPKPTVAVIQGACVGGGCSIAVACDLRLADSTARFGITPARLGIVYPAHALERVTQLVGPATAKWLIYTGDLIDAEWAWRSGLIDALHPTDSLDAAVIKLTTTMAQRSLFTQQATKEMVASLLERGAVDKDLAEHWATQSHSGPDAGEGLAAFRDGRRPRFVWPSNE